MTDHNDHSNSRNAPRKGMLEKAKKRFDLFISVVVFLMMTAVVVGFAVALYRINTMPGFTEEQTRRAESLVQAIGHGELRVSSPPIHIGFNRIEVVCGGVTNTMKWLVFADDDRVGVRPNPPGYRDRNDHTNVPFVVYHDQIDDNTAQAVAGRLGGDPWCGQYGPSGNKTQKEA